MNEQSSSKTRDTFGKRHSFNDRDAMKKAKNSPDLQKNLENSPKCNEELENSSLVGVLDTQTFKMFQPNENERN